MVRYGHEAAFKIHLLGGEDSLTSVGQIASILKQVEADNIAAQQRAQNLNPELHGLEDVTARERRVAKEPNIGLQIFTLEVLRRHQQLDVVHPDHLALVLERKVGVDELLVHLVVVAPEADDEVVIVALVRALEVVEERTQELLLEKDHVFQLVLL